MDAESRRRRRESSISLREQRWSMSSQRLEQIVAALMKPVSHYGQSFDRDDSGLLEEYLTAAGVHALEAVEAGQEPPPPNYAEMGLVIQSFANNYSKKVDHLSRLINSFSQTLDANNLSRSADAEADPSGLSPEPAARRRLASSPGGGAAGAGGFARIELQAGAGAGARRGAALGGPPPTLARGYAEQQPRGAAERALADYAAEPIGSLDDFRVAWRLHNGFLVEELECGAGESGEELRPLSLMELQEACARAAAPAPAPLSPHTPPSARSPSPSPPCMPPPAALKRKRRSEVHIEDLQIGSFNIDINKVVRKRLSEVQEFSVSERWIQRVVRHRRDDILRARTAAAAPEREFRGFDMSWMDIGGFAGWSAAEAAAAGGAARRAAALRGALHSDDFCERSSGLGACSRFSADRRNQASDADAESWQAGVVRRAEAERAPDLRALASHVRRALPPPPAALPWHRLARRPMPPPALLLLDILMQASRGTVEIEQGDPLAVGDFSVRVVSEQAPAPVDDDEWLAMLGAAPPPAPSPPSPPSAPSPRSPPDEP